VKPAFKRGKKVVDDRAIEAKYRLICHGSDGCTIYTATLWADGTTSCNCPAWRFERKGVRKCKHATRALTLTADIDETGGQPVRATSAVVEEPRPGIVPSRQRSRPVDT
jgi:hypothetical protein